MATPDVIATFTIAGQTFTDVNPIAREARQYDVAIRGVRPANCDQATMHAEFGAMFQAYTSGIRGGIGVLDIRGMKCCPWCRGDIKTLARAMQLDSLVVHDADGSSVEFAKPQDLLPIRQGGKSWS